MSKPTSIELAVHDIPEEINDHIYEEIKKAGFRVSTIISGYLMTKKGKQLKTIPSCSTTFFKQTPTTAMSNRLDKEKEAELQPKRMEYATQSLHAVGIKSIFAVSDSCLEFVFKDEKIKFFPYSGWHTGKSIVDGRGLQKLLNQLKQQP